MSDQVQPVTYASTYCGHCFKAMRHNVPRLGAAGGWVHADTGYVLCGPRPEIKWFMADVTYNDINPMEGGPKIANPSPLQSIQDTFEGPEPHDYD